MRAVVLLIQMVTMTTVSNSQRVLIVSSPVHTSTALPSQNSVAAFGSVQSLAKLVSSLVVASAQ